MTKKRKPREARSSKKENEADAKKTGKQKSVPLGRFVICPCGGSGRHSHEHDVACEVLESPKGNFFFTCRECLTRGFLNTWERSYGFTLPEVENRPGTRVVGVPPQRRLKLLKDLGLMPIPQPGYMAPPHMPGAPMLGRPPS
jgi:hypothetical protein